MYSQFEMYSHPKRFLKMVTNELYQCFDQTVIIFMFESIISVHPTHDINGNSGKPCVESVTKTL